jgi:hypothetical protein
VKRAGRLPTEAAREFTSALFMSHHHHTDPPKKKLHQDWRFIVAVVLMLIAMIVYVLTLDDAVVPGKTPAPAPATANP